MLQESIDNCYYDQVVPIPGPAGVEWSRKLAAREGITAGISGGAAFAAAMTVAESAPPGTVLLCMLPDTGERYLSSALFEGIVEGMTDEEYAISQTTPGFGAGLSLFGLDEERIRIISSISLFTASDRLSQLRRKQTLGGRNRPC